MTLPPNIVFAAASCTAPNAKLAPRVDAKDTELAEPALTVNICIPMLLASTVPAKLMLAPAGTEPPLVVSKMVEPANTTGPLKV